MGRLVLPYKYFLAWKHPERLTEKELKEIEEEIIRDIERNQRNARWLLVIAVIGGIATMIMMSLR